jgi:hypothetical protein
MYTSRAAETCPCDLHVDVEVATILEDDAHASMIIDQPPQCAVSLDVGALNPPIIPLKSWCHDSPKYVTYEYHWTMMVCASMAFRAETNTKAGIVVERRRLATPLTVRGSIRIPAEEIRPHIGSVCDSRRWWLPIPAGSH